MRPWSALPAGRRRLLCRLAITSSILLLSSTHPTLDDLTVTGTLPSNERRFVPFVPPFVADVDSDILNYKCLLDHAMDRFELGVDPRPPAILSKLTRDGIQVPDRANLTEILLRPGEKTIFSIDVTGMHTTPYTLIVERRTGKSTELMQLRPLTGNFTRPFHAGELQDRFDATQAFHQDFFRVEFVKADGGQTIECLIEEAATVGENSPSHAQVYYHPHAYIPSLEQQHHLSVHEQYARDTGATAHCNVPIDTWRRITVGLAIVSATRRERREIRLVVTRHGCSPGSFYHRGSCLPYCPTFFYTQRFNWRCGACGIDCEFCDNWMHCNKCRRSSAMISYVKDGNGTCVAVRVHPYRIYYDIARYLGLSCVVLISCYAFACVFWVTRQTCWGEIDDEEGSTSARERFRRKAALASGPLE